MEQCYYDRIVETWPPGRSGYLWNCRRLAGVAPLPPGVVPGHGQGERRFV